MSREQFIHANLSRNADGHLMFAGADTVELAEKYGTPLMLLDEAGIRANCRNYLQAARKHFGQRARVLYASKALSFTGLYKILAEEGVGIDVASLGEMYAAKAAGFDLSNAYFHGNFKTDEELEFAISGGIGCIVIDNREEVSRVNAVAVRCRRVQKILVRVVPNVDPHTHKAIVTGSADSKFGVAFDEAEVIVAECAGMKGIDLHGFHCHIGSQIFESEPFVEAARTMIQFIERVKEKTGFCAREMNLGGGFGVRYIERQAHMDIDGTIAKIAQSIALPIAVTIEPGRSIIAANGVTVYTVGCVKGKYVIIDGGMTDNPRFALYGAPYSVLEVKKPFGGEKKFIATVAGRACESGDIIAENVEFSASPKIGDRIAVLVTGAYNYSMSSNYNRFTRPPIVMIDAKGQDRVTVKRESVEDLVRLDY